MNKYRPHCGVLIARDRCGCSSKVRIASFNQSRVRRVSDKIDSQVHFKLGTVVHRRTLQVVLGLTYHVGHHRIVMNVIRLVPRELCLGWQLGMDLPIAIKDVAPYLSR